MDKFYEFLVAKYGKPVTNRLFQENRLLTENIKEKNVKDQKFVLAQLKKIQTKLNLDLEIGSKERLWAFDFPGWTGKLNFNKRHVRKYMVIGLEPHIEEFDYQITFGLSDRTPLTNEKRFSIGANDSILCNNSRLTIWTNLFNLLAPSETRKSVHKGKNEKTLMRFLNQFYITDLCHFAPQGRANEIHNVDNWEDKRLVVAKHFLMEEIKNINPEIIIAGNTVFKIIIELLGVNESEDRFKILEDNRPHYVNVARKDKLRIIGFPDIGSKRQQTFWMKKLKDVRDYLTSKQHI